VYHAEADPVEQCFQERGLLLDFEITGGIPETLPRLLEALKPFTGGSSSTPELKEHTA
jgi:adenylate kinase